MAKLTHRDVYLFVPNLIGYTRVLCSIYAMIVARTSPITFTIFYFVSFVLDALDGKAARMWNQCSDFGSVLDMVTDRCSTSMLLVILGSLFTEYSYLFAFALALDISSHWFHMYSAIKGGEHHKSQTAQQNWLMRLYYGNFYFFGYLCVGAEIFYIALYLTHFFPVKTTTISTLFSSPEILRDVWALFALGLLYLCLPGFVLKQMVNVVQLCSAADKCVEGDVKARAKPAK